MDGSVTVGILPTPQRLEGLARRELLGVLGDLHPRRGQAGDRVRRNHAGRAVGIPRDGHAVEDPLRLGAEHGRHATEILAVRPDDERLGLDVAPGHRVVGTGKIELGSAGLRSVVSVPCGQPAARAMPDRTPIRRGATKLVEDALQVPGAADLVEEDRAQGRIG